MQCLKGDLWIVPKLGSCRRTKKNAIWGFDFPVFHGGTCGFSSNSRAVGCYGNFLRDPKYNLGCGFSLSGFSRLNKASRFRNKHKRVSLGSLVALALALEQQELDWESVSGPQTEEFGAERAVSGPESEKSLKVDVREIASSLRHAKTVDDVDEILRDTGDYLPPQVYSTLIRFLGKEKLIDPALAVFKWIERRRDETEGSVAPNLFTYNSLLGALKQSRRFGAASEVLSDMASRGVSPNVVTYNTRMAILIEQGRFPEALSVLDEISEAGLVPSPVSYSTAMLTYRRTENPSGAVRFFAEVRERYRNGEIGEDDGGDLVTELSKLEDFVVRICYQVMRNWLAKNDRSSGSGDVLRVLREMDGAEIPIGRSELERLMWACTREDHAHVAKELYDRIREMNGSDISLSVCNHAIWLMGKAKRWWAALAIYEDLLDKGPNPNNMSNEIIVSHFNVLLSAARKRGIWKWGVRLLNRMEEKGLRPTSREWNSVLVACSKASETGAAVEIFRRMVDRGQRPTAVSYGALLSALEKGKCYGEARRVWDHMVKVGVAPNAYAYTIMASVFAGQGKFGLVETVLTEMASAGIDPAALTYNAVLRGCARNGMGGPALEWLRRMMGSKVPPNSVSYETVIVALAEDSKPRLAYELYLRARNEGLDLAAKAYDAVVESSRVNGATVDLRLLGNRPPEKR